MVSVMFRWVDQPSARDENDPDYLRGPAARSTRTGGEGCTLWVEMENGSKRPVTGRELTSMVGASEAKRLVKVAIRRGTSKWHPADAHWKNDFTEY